MHADANKHPNSIPGFWSLGYSQSRGWIQKDKQESKMKYRIVKAAAPFMEQDWFRLERAIEFDRWDLVASGFLESIQKHAQRLKDKVPEETVVEEFEV